ncbi:hypothetical protein PSN45_001748 [Yamadazyma tenuis]|uniref:uncharacterized protein n=1 Tax=Candida tenuis TaxID=2315449 RepID=UPI002798DA46|nr:hypothetical protein PSN45_001748 [Yamadazyma tenuis]
MRPDIPAMTKDDLHLVSSKRSPSPERRARSSSPVKDRRSLPPNFFDMKLPSLPYATSDDLRSLSSLSSSGNSGSSSVSIDSLKKLSNSPLSKRLHINTAGDAGHVIPIPFTITLPPKLSPKNKAKAKSRSRSPSPTRSKSPSKSPEPKPKSRLVFTGSGYEKIDTSSSEDDEPSDFDTSLDTIKWGTPPRNLSSSPSSRLPPPIASARSRQGPPPVKSNRRKSVKRVSHQRQMKADELSIIEEQSNSGASSRSSSIRGRKDDEKSLPPPPESLEEETSEILSPAPEQVRSNVRMMSSPASAAPMEPIMSPEEATQVQLPRFSSENVLNATKISASNSAQYLQIHKRSFSDESHVSSVSSFSSVGDVLSFASRRTNMYGAEPIVQRDVSGSSMSTVESQSSDHESESTISQGSNASWESLQKSIDLNRGEDTASSVDEDDDDEYETTISSEKSYTPEVSQPNESFKEANESELVAYYSNLTLEDKEQEIAEAVEEVAPVVPETIQQIVSEASQVDDEEEEVTNQSQDTIEFKSTVTPHKEDDNKGAGKKFNFPNNLHNITNDEITKKRVISTETYKSSKSRISFYSTMDGQIEIPDLSEASFSDATSMRKSILSINGTTFNDLITDDETENETLEPIGIPSQRGRRIVTEQFKHLYDSSDSESDASSTNFSAYNTVKSKSTSNLNAKKNSELPPLPSDVQRQTQTPMRVNHSRNYSRHSRHKSMGHIDFNLADLMKKPETEESPKSPETSEATEKPTANEELNIQVAEPPQPISYQVDFKDSTGKENDLNRTYTPTMNELRKIKSGKATSSVTDSSYQSSRSAKLSASTDISDVESVVIDLTADEKYDVCMIQRQDSTLSYKSVTELHRGKEVEVVLVEEDDEVDLESIYSKYGRNWLGRSSSTRSDASSSSSTFSYNSMASDSQLRLKQISRREPQIGTIVTQRMMERTNGSMNSNTSSKYNSRRIKMPKQISQITKEANQSIPEGQQKRPEEEKYFDYTKSSSYYDFSTFIHQKNQDLVN